MCVSDEPETRDAWWEEIRQEIKSHAKALGCHAVVGYSESTSIWYYLHMHRHRQSGLVVPTVLTVFRKGLVSVTMFLTR